MPDKLLFVSFVIERRLLSYKLRLRDRLLCPDRSGYDSVGMWLGRIYQLRHLSGGRVLPFW